MKKSFLYTRVSTKEQSGESATSLDFQVEVCTQYAERNGFEVVGVYQDDFTGRVRERPALMQMEHDLARREIDAVIIWTFDRLARHFRVGMELIWDWAEQGIETHSVDEGGVINPATWEGIVSLSVKAKKTDDESNQIRERTMRGRNKQVEDKGRIMPTGHPTFGYKIVNKGLLKQSRYEIDETEAEVVRMIFRWYTSGDGNGHPPMTLSEIGDRLKENKIPPPRPPKKCKVLQWRLSTLRRILANELYNGVFCWGKTRMIRKNKLQKKSTLVKKPKDEWIRVDVPELALVDPETFATAARNLKLNRDLSKRNAKHDYLLSGHLFCGACNRRMTGTVTAYYCTSRSIKHDRCEAAFRNISVRKADGIVWEWLSWLLSDEQHLIEGIESMGEQQESQSYEKRQSRDRLQKSADDLERRINGLIEDLSYFRERGSNQETVAAFRRQIDDLSTARAALITSIQEIDNELAEQALSQDNVERVFDYVRKVRDRLPQATFDDKRYLLRLFDVRAEYISSDEERRLDVSCAVPAWNQSFDLQRSKIVAISQWMA